MNEKKPEPAFVLCKKMRTMVLMVHNNGGLLCDVVVDQTRSKKSVETQSKKNKKSQNRHCTYFAPQTFWSPPATVTRATQEKKQAGEGQ